MKIPVDVQADFIQRLASVSGRPLTGVLELVWNALDADATEVVVSFDDLCFFLERPLRLGPNNSAYKPYPSSSEV